ncbi:MAG: response regulator [Euryarchaeota archaeon]|nr:response regulator [Euryarchaeota archaeon]
MIKILAVDDDRILLEVLKSALEIVRDIEVDTATSAGEALEYLRSSDYDAIISDYLMPDMDGIIFLKKVRISYPNLSFIIFTGKGEEDVVIEALKHNADLYIKKEVDVDFFEISNQIREVVKLKRVDSALNEINDRFRIIFEAASDAIILIDEDGYIMLWNPAAEKMFGYYAEVAIGERVEDLIFPESAQFLYSRICQEICSFSGDDIPGRTFEVIARRNNSGNPEEFPVEISLSVSLLNRKMYLIAIIRDRTDIDSSLRLSPVLDRNHRTGGALVHSDSLGNLNYDRSQYGQVSIWNRNQKLNQKMIHWIIQEKGSGVSSSVIAKAAGVSKRRVEQIWKQFRDTGEEPVIGKKTGRPEKPPDPGEMEIVRKAYLQHKMSAKKLESFILAEYNINIPYKRIQKYLLRLGMIENNSK